MRLLLFCLFSLIGFVSYSQDSITTDQSAENFEIYNKLCPILGGDSVRFCNGIKCVGQVKDFYPDGKLKHKGYYDGGQLISMFDNYFENGNVERHFQAKSDTRGVIEEYYPNGKIKSKGEYINGEMLKWEDYYEDGHYEFAEEYDKGIEYHLYTRIYYEDGSPKILFELIDKKQRIYTYKEYYSNGNIKEDGTKIQNITNGDYKQDGIWKYYDESGKLILEEEYIRGMLNSEKKY
ncbi:MAG TPA: hypothetical protein PKI01_09425 [Bacteroidales bacterium]|nr:hypothetical protein [Bacteroidales bacterium]